MVCDPNPWKEDAAKEHQIFAKILGNSVSKRR